MRKITFTKKALALFLAIAMVVSGIYFPKSNVRIVHAEDETEATDVVEEGTEEVVPEDAVAKIGSEYYTSLGAALDAAKASDSAVTITLLKNISDATGEVPTSGFAVQNTAGNKITIDGINKSERTVTAGTAVKNLFNVQCEFELKNVAVDYKGINAAIVINAATTTSLANVTINAENVGPNANSYLKDAIIDVCAAGEHTLNLTNTNITVVGPEGTDLNSTFYPVIRTNAGLSNSASINHKTRIVTMNIKNSTLDASAAVGRLGIWVTRGTVGNVILDNSHIKTVDGPGSAGTNSSVVNRAVYGQIVSNVAPDDKIILTGGSTLTCGGEDGKPEPLNFITCVARIGNQFYETFAGAVADANIAEEDAKIEFFSDITIGGDTPSSETGNVTITNANDVEITIDGHRHTVYTKAKHAISIRRSGTVNLQNMDIIHTGHQSALQVAASNNAKDAINAVINVTNVDFTVNNTTDGNIAQYGLILVPNIGRTTLKFLESDVTMTAKTGTHAILRTGNDGNSKNIDITLEDCEWNVSATSGRRGIQLMSATAGTLKLIGSTIHTKDATPIYDNSGLVEITKTRATLTCDNKEAQIGNDLKSFADAIEIVNSSEKNITVEILKDISSASQITFRNDHNGVVNTFDGNGHTMTVTGTGGNSIVIYGSVDGTGTYEFKNVNFVQQRDGVLLQLNKENAQIDETTGEVTRLAHTSKQAILKLKNVTITNTNNGGYKYGLITTLPTDSTITLDFDKVNVALAFDSDTLASDSGIGAGVIRTGNNDAKNITINLNKCNFNIENSAKTTKIKVKGILVTNNSNATINMTDSNITTANVASIHANASVGVDNKIIFSGECKLDSATATYKSAPIEGYDAQAGTTVYRTFAAALAGAEAGATIKLLRDVTLSGKTTAIQKSITIDGNGYELASDAGTTSDKHAFTIGGEATEVTFKNIKKLVQNRKGMIVSTSIPTTLTMKDVNIVTGESVSTEYALFNLTSAGKTKLIFDHVVVDMNATASGIDYPGIIRTGNADTAKEVEIILRNNCDLNAEGAEGRHGIVIVPNTTATLNLSNSKITTLDVLPIKDHTGNASITKTNCELTYTGVEAVIGDNLYKTFAEAVAAANKSTSHVTVEILKDITMSSFTLVNNNNGAGVTFEGNGHKITTSETSGNAFIIQGTPDGTGIYEFKNVDIVHGKSGVLVQLNQKEVETTNEETGEKTKTITHSTKKATLKMSNVDITSVDDGGYKYGLITTLPSGSDTDMTVELNNVDVTLNYSSDTLDTDKGIGAGVIRTGNNNVKNVTIRLTDCNFNLENAAQIKGILVTNSSNANIFLNDTDIKTKTVAPIHANASAGENNTITLEGDCTLDSVAAEYKPAPVQGYDVKVGNQYYRTFANAIAGAEAGATVELLKNVTISNTKIEKSITIDGNGHTITSDEGTSTNKHLFEIQGDATEVTFRNISSLVHMRRGMIVSANIPTTLTMENINIDATKAPVSNEYALFNLLGEGGRTKLIWNNVKVDMDATAAGKDSNVAIIRTGNTDEKVVDITLTDCELNTEGAEGRHGITIINRTTAILNLTRTKITTLDVLPIKDNSGNATINTEDCEFTYTGVEAVIGDNLYKTFAEALAAANEAETDVTIEILKDISIGAGNTIANENGHSITIEGHNHILTATGGQHTFMITTTQVGTVEFKNMTIKHQNRGSAVQIADSITGEKLTVTLTDVTIDATESENGYDHAIINVLNKNTTDLVMTDVIITMSTETAGSSVSPYWGIIRTGNPGSSNAKTVNMTLDNCELDASGAAGRYGIVVVANTTANITLKNNTKIKTNDVAPIKNYSTTSQKLTIGDDCTFEATVPIDGYVAQIDNVLYTSFNTARTDANKAKESVTIKLLTDLEVTENVWINNENGKTITIDGNGHRVTTGGGKNINAFCIDKACTVVLKNMTVDHKNMGSVVQVTANANGVNLSLIDVTINANNADNDESNYRYALINVAASATVNLTNVIVDMDVETAAKDFPGIVRTGNHNQEKTVTINVNGGNWNTEGAVRRHGIVIMNDTHAEVNLIGATITTADVAPIADYSQKAVITRDDATTTTCTGNYAAYVLTLGNQPTHTAYETFAEALTAANGFKGNATLGLLKDVSVGAVSIGNANGKVLVEGNANTITTEKGNHAFTVNQNKEVEFRNMTIAHKRYGAAIQVSAEGAVLTLANVVLDATYASELTNTNKTYNYAMINLTTSSTLNMVNSSVIMVVEPLGDGGGNQSSIIRTGNKDSSDNTYKEITINLTDCILDTTNATNRSGILVVDAKADINLKGNTKILTGAYLEGKNCAAIRGLEGTKVAKISMEETCVLMTGESTAYADVVKNLTAGITDACTWTYKLYENLAAFRTAEGLKVPTNVPAGYVFAGWYTDKACTQEFALSNTDIETTSAYAKFVPEHVLGVKAQISANLIDEDDTNDAKGDIRFVTTVDGLDYEIVGFTYQIVLDGRVLKTGSSSSGTVYRTLYAVGATAGERIDYTPEYEFCAESQYFKTMTIKNIPQSAFGAEITVTPFWETLDGTTVYGEPVTKTVQQGIDAHDKDGNTTDTPETPTVYTNRVVMVSDLHYTTSMEKAAYDAENQKYDPNSLFGKYLAHLNPNASWAAGNAFGYTQEQKIQAALDDIHAYGAKNPINAVMVLGDLTLDDYGYRNLVDNYLDNFKTDFLDKLQYKPYAIAGNHDSYTNTEWKNTIGTDRQYSVEIEGSNAVFIMLDTFAAKHATGSNGSEYIGIDVEWLEEELAKYPTQNIFLCTHYYQEGEHPEKDAVLNTLMQENPRIVSLFRAHSHKNTVKNPATLAGAPIVDIGGYAYNGQQEDNGSYDFNIFNKTWAWGYQVVEWNEDEVHIYHVKPARNYTDSAGKVHNYKGAIEDDIVIKLK